MNPCKVTVTLNLPLTPDQVETKANEATRLMSELDNMDEDFKLIKREWNQNIKALKIRMRKLVQAYNTKTEAQEVEATQYFDMGTKETWFMHDGTEYDRRELTEDEVDELKNPPILNDGPNVAGVDHAATAAM